LHALDKISLTLSQVKESLPLVKDILVEFALKELDSPN